MIEGNGNGTKWSCFGSQVSKALVVFVVQVVIVYIVVITSIVNLSLGHDDSKLWTALLSANIGYLLPNPSLKEKQ